jgi:hypothetical protein
MPFAADGFVVEVPDFAVEGDREREIPPEFWKASSSPNRSGKRTVSSSVKPVTF